MATTTLTNNSSNVGTTTPSFQMTTGWWVAVGCTGAVILSGVDGVNAFAGAIMAIAVIYQLNQLLANRKQTS
jgi:hypothetical protein